MKNLLLACLAGSGENAALAPYLERMQYGRRPAGSWREGIEYRLLKQQLRVTLQGSPRFL